MDYISILKDNNLKATPQRIGVLKILAKKTHPTIDELYNEIKIENPSISLATIYKNLKALIDSEIIIEINVFNKKARYDILDAEHIHLVCNNCGDIKDVDYVKADLVNYKNMLSRTLQTKINSLSIIANSQNCPKCQN